MWTVYCIHCGKQNLDTAKFCTSCGTSLAAQAPLTPMKPPSPTEANRTGLPLGIVLCALMNGVNGVLSILVAVPLFGAYYYPQLQVLALATFIWGILSLAAAYGLFRLVPWGWALTVVLNVLSIVFLASVPLLWELWQQFMPSIFEKPGAGIIIIIAIFTAISVVIILYLLKPNVRALLKQP